jgi:hypothetical protein
MEKVDQCTTIRKNPISMEVTGLWVRRYQLEPELHLPRNIRRRRTLQLQCMEMEQLIKAKFLKLPTWPDSGNCHVCSFARITITPWELLWKDMLTILSFILEVIKFLEFE